jgi:hypothetical protein
VALWWSSSSLALQVSKAINFSSPAPQTTVKRKTNVIEKPKKTLKRKQKTTRDQGQKRQHTATIHSVLTHNAQWLKQENIDNVYFIVNNITNTR